MSAPGGVSCRSWTGFLLASYIGRLVYETSQSVSDDRYVFDGADYFIATLTPKLPRSLPLPPPLTHCFCSWSITSLANALGIAAAYFSLHTHSACCSLTFSLLLAETPVNPKGLVTMSYTSVGPPVPFNGSTDTGGDSSEF